MAVKANVVTGEVVPQKPFPKLARFKVTGNIYYLTSLGCGICLKDIDSRASATWGTTLNTDYNCWEDFNQPIMLQNL